MEMMKFAKIDWLKTKSQAKIIVAYIIFASIIGVYMDFAMWALFYIAFGATVAATTPYFIDSTSTNGFINLLPAKVSSRVYGRYLFGLLFTTICILLGEISVVAYCIITKKTPSYILELSIVIITVALLFNAFQYLILSLIKIKNQQALSLIRLIPPFVMYFGGTYAMDYISKEKERGIQMISSISKYCLDNSLKVSIAFLLFSVLMTVLVALISGVCESKRES